MYLEVLFLYTQAQRLCSLLYFGDDIWSRVFGCEVYLISHHTLHGEDCPKKEGPFLVSAQINTYDPYRIHHPISAYYMYILTDITTQLRCSSLLNALILIYDC